MLPIPVFLHSLRCIQKRINLEKFFMEMIVSAESLQIPCSLEDIDNLYIFNCMKKVLKDIENTTYFRSWDRMKLPKNYDRRISMRKNLPKNLSSDWYVKYNGHRPEEYNAEIQIVVDLYPCIIYRSEYMMRTVRLKETTTWFRWQHTDDKYYMEVARWLKK